MLKISSLKTNTFWPSSSVRYNPVICCAAPVTDFSVDDVIRGSLVMGPETPICQSDRPAGTWAS